MYTEPVSVFKLKQHWKAVDMLAEGEGIEVIPLRCMPPWNDICFELDWKSYLVQAGHFSKKRHGFQGVYRLIALAAEGDLRKPATLNRVCGQDMTGTLYIGRSASLNNRANLLRRSLLSRESREVSHNAISMLRSIPILQFPSNKLALALLFTGRDTRGVERDLIQAYMNSFGDTPPLNYDL